MTRKHYNMIANVIAELISEADENAQVPEAERRMAWAIATNLSHELKRDNPGFDRDTFMKACGFECNAY